MACQEVVELLNDYREDVLDAHRRARLDAHLAECPYCVSYLEQLLLATRLSSRLQVHDVPELVMASLLEVFRAR